MELRTVWILIHIEVGDMNSALTILLFAVLISQLPTAPKIRRLSVTSNYSTEVIFRYASPVLIENEPLKTDAVECFVSRLKATGLFTDVRVTLSPTEDGKWVDIDVVPTWDKRRKSFVISEVDFDGFVGFDLVKLSEALEQRGVRPGVSLWEFALWEIGNKLDEAASTIYASDDPMMKRIADVDMPHPRLYLQVIDSVNLRLTISLNRQYPCRSQ